MKQVIINFDTDEQAQKFFDIFTDVPSAEEQTRKPLNAIMDYCDVDSVDTKQEDDHYRISCS